MNFEANMEILHLVHVLDRSWDIWAKAKKCMPGDFDTLVNNPNKITDHKVASSRKNHIFPLHMYFVRFLLKSVQTDETLSNNLDIAANVTIGKLCHFIILSSFFY